MLSNFWQRLPAAISSKRWSGTSQEDADRSSAVPAAKRILDLVTAAVSLVILAPFLLLIAAAVRLDSRGPVLYISPRLGRNGRVFRCLKFRTITRRAQVTRIGSFLRRYGLDELPQLFNVLRGEMSIVGPRPVLASDSPASQTARLPRFDMNPGMTGLWAIQPPSYEPFRAYVSPDDTYRKNWSLWLDVGIILRSLAAALAGNGC